MTETYLTTEEAEEIIMAVEVGVYDIDYPGNRSKLAHAKLLLATQPESDFNMRSGDFCNTISMRKGTE